MNIPGFVAESSLGPALGLYRGRAVHFQISGGFVARLDAVKPQQMFGLGLGVENTVGLGDCFGSAGRCITKFCNHLSGKQRAACVIACNQPSKCGGCDCTFTPAGVRTCQRTCTRKSPPGNTFQTRLTCTGSCFGLDELAPV
jgi:hypothetical protein